LHDEAERDWARSAHYRAHHRGAWWRGRRSEPERRRHHRIAVHSRQAGRGRPGHQAADTFAAPLPVARARAAGLTLIGSRHHARPSMAHRKRLLFVCVNRRPDGTPKGSCAARGGVELHAKLKSLIKERGLAETEIRACTSSCLDACWAGPCIAVEPDHVYYGR